MDVEVGVAFLLFNKSYSFVVIVVFCYCCTQKRRETTQRAPFSSKRVPDAEQRLAAPGTARSSEWRCGSRWARCGAVRAFGPGRDRPIPAVPGSPSRCAPGERESERERKRKDGQGAMGCAAWLAAGCLLSAVITRTPNGIASAEPGLRRSLQLPCVFEMRKTIPLSNETETVLLNVRLLLPVAGAEGAQRPQTESLPADNLPSFIVQEPSVNILQHTDEDINMLDCRISHYFTANTQILWPGREVRAHSLDTWFTCTIKHTAGKYTATAFLVQGHEDREHQTPGQLHQGIAEQTHVSAVLAVRALLPLVRTALGKDAVLDCAFDADPRAAVAVRWALRQKGRPERRITTSGGGRAEMFPQEPRGNASLLLRRVELGDEGTYICAVQAAALVLEQAILLQITEKPTVTVNVNSLSLVEGEQQKLVCDVRNYYPADIHVQWLREPRGAGRLPDTVPNVLTSSHRRSSNGTYSFSRFFLLTATLHEDGHTYTCRVEHSSLQAPIRRSVSVAVREATSIAWLLLLLLGLTGCLVAALHHLYKARSTTKPKPY
ncbi:tapasin-related protein-like isoform X3 [Tympanuchus pallidicinctus]|uniref:tapasin-related protein-like isoform X3 n=1 Tax=Tympanuchus pallidicinctus TaxID=109042 RepID=UPI002286D65F|nr:tapasin-related protein-like isoform X3 [Tympanuchus pallidicinctus]